MSLLETALENAMNYLNPLQRVLEHLPIRGKARIADFLLARNAAEVKCHPVPGATVFLRTDQRIERWMWAGTYEPELVSLLRNKLRPGRTFLDLGANIGYFSAIAAALVGPTGRIHAFEPMPQNFLRLQKNLRPFEWAIPHPWAVGRTTARVTMHYSDTEAGWASAYEDDNMPLSTTVDMITLDGWLAACPIERIDFIKLDIEGFELEALLGAEVMLRRFRPTIVAETKADWCRKGVCDFLGAANYECRLFNNDCVLASPLT